MTGLHLSQYIPPVIFLFGIIVILLVLLRNSHIGIYFMAMLVPLENVLKKLYDFPLGNNFMDIFIIVLMLGWFLHKSNKFEHTMFNKPLLFLIIYTYISLWIGTLYYGDSLPIFLDNLRLLTWKNYILIYLLFWIIFNNITTKNQIIILTFIITFSILIVNYSFSEQLRYVQTYHFSNKMRQVGGTFSYLGPNHLGSFFSQYGMMLLGMFLFEKKTKLRNIFLFIVSIWCFHSVLYSFSRGAYLGTVFAIIILFFLKNKKLLIIISIISLIFWSSILPQSVIDRINMTKNEEGELDSSSQARVEVWNEALDMAKKNPLTGLGFDTFWHGDPHFGGLKDTHNYYLKVIAEQGVIGLLIFLYLLYLCIKSSLKLFRTSKDNFFKGLGLGGVGCIISVVTSNLFGDRWTFFMMSGYFWIFLALIERANIINANDLQLLNQTKGKL